MAARVESVNPHILRQCREQIGLSIERAQRKVKTIDKMERGETFPTFNQMKELASLYRVPQWVFIKETLPSQYNFSVSMQSFRRFPDSGAIFDDYQVRGITAKVERLRNLILEFRDDMKEPIREFSPPSIHQDSSVFAQSVREWLGCLDSAYSFEDWKEAIENKDVLVFLTSKYRGWANVPPNLFRGFCIYDSRLPVIVVNDSDTRKAQSFTLFHELGHLLSNESTLDIQNDFSQSESERWNDKFAGEVLLPREAFVQEVRGMELISETQDIVEKIDEISQKFQVSSYACAVRMNQLGCISQKKYETIQNYLKERYERLKNEGKGNRKMKRNIAKEKLRQYGGLYSKTMVQAYRDQEIGLHKLCKLFEIKKATDALKLESLL